jgi:large subunit ribosomal protein L23
VTTDPRDIVLRPVVSEKSYGLLDRNVYTFGKRADTKRAVVTLSAGSRIDLFET